MSEIPVHLAVDLSGPAIVYDGECPFCRSYVRLLKLRESLGSVSLIDARKGGGIVEYLQDEGISLDEGMVLVLNRRFFHGEDCIHRLALLSSKSTLFNVINAWIFKRKKISKILYPILRTGRNISLIFLGKKKITSKKSRQRSQ